MVSIPAWPDAASAAGVTFFGRAHTIASAWKAHGVSNAVALGFVANAEAESSFDPNAVGDKGAGGAYGLYQRHYDRIIAIRDGVKDAHGKVVKPGLGFDLRALVIARANTMQNDVEAAWWELQSFSFYGFAAIPAQGTAHGAAAQICATFERAGAEFAADRRG
jgi:hypothetical protein